ncbi:hypothetical protein RclHR1_02120007 [Rhizophagus clarus]|uniref:Kinase-like domain-containing protein n=1 Tax=Rhizophagus clarus TaxID=94130 RepID=A0A2Z6QUD7_9GLOM|nr:hypothetical protein RclHR1_02120007 [Rhizophagus clarus]GES90914.1 kinase-like domain-containing protein [Rhizophagus clarus]
MQVADHPNEYINWFKNAISNELLKLYEYEDFRHIEEIGNGAYGKVYRANWKNVKYFAFKSFNLDKIRNIKNAVYEFKIHREVDFHENIIRFYGISVKEKNNYLLVMEYADGGTLRSYLKKNKALTWESKYELACQLASAVSCLHNVGIMHHDLHSKNILIHQNTIKLADFGLSKRFNENYDDVSEMHSYIYGILPYIDSEKLRDKENYRSNEKSDIYSVGVLLWEISSGRPPFEKEPAISLQLRIVFGLRETAIPNTPEDYKNLYSECWDADPNKRPEINQVVIRLKSFVPGGVQSTPEDYKNLYSECWDADPNKRPEINQVVNRLESFVPDGVQSDDGDQSSSEQKFSEAASSQMIVQNFDKTYNIEVMESINILEQAINEIISIVHKSLSKRKSVEKNIFDYRNNHNVTSQNIYDWLLNNQNKPETVFLLGCYNYYGIVTNLNYKKAFELFEGASKQNYMLAQYYVGLCYQYGHGITKDKELAFKSFKKTANNDFATGQLRVGTYYKKKKDFEKAFSWHEKAAENGNHIAQFYLGLIYKNGQGITTDYIKAFELFEQSAKGGYPNGIAMLGYCYSNGVGTRINKKKAIELYQEAASLGHNRARYILALAYKDGEHLKKNHNKAFELAKKSAEGGDVDGMFMVAYCYCDGFGTDIDKQKAIEFYQKAANLGHSKAQYNLAIMYENGEGVEKDYNKAFKLFEQSSRREVNGMYKLGYFYKNGIGTIANKQMAIELYQKAANRGHIAAGYNLACMYEGGGIEDCKKAIVLLKDPILKLLQKNSD